MDEVMKLRLEKILKLEKTDEEKVSLIMENYHQEEKLRELMAQPGFIPDTLLESRVDKIVNSDQSTGQRIRGILQAHNDEPGRKMILNRLFRHLSFIGKMDKTCFVTSHGMFWFVDGKPEDEPKD